MTFKQKVQLAWKILRGQYDPEKELSEELKHYRHILWSYADSYEHWEKSGYKSYDYMFSCQKDLDKILQAGKKIP